MGGGTLCVCAQGCRLSSRHPDGYMKTSCRKDGAHPPNMTLPYPGCWPSVHSVWHPGGYGEPPVQLLGAEVAGEWSSVPRYSSAELHS